MTDGSWATPKVGNRDTSVLWGSFSTTQRSAIRRELRSVADQFGDMPYREVRRALRYKVRDFAKMYGVEPEVILQAIKCSDVNQFIQQ
ncbi:MAG: hypothetical protein QOC63_3917 [Mycobacterium sp.]|jgi:hypothetical protein|nr:hypothetical protein [Mycobacterium sp.]